MAELTRVSKLPEQYEGTEPSYDERLEFYDRRQNHNKFWHIRVYGPYVVRHFGRHGTKGQTQIHKAYSSWDAREQADKLYWQKKDKGYVKDNTTVLDRLARETM